MTNTNPMMEKYVEISWCPADVKSLYEHWSDEKCQEMLFKISNYFEDRLIESGWEIMEILLDMMNDEEDEDE